MSFTVREALKHDYDAVCALNRQVHDIHAHARPDIYVSVEKPLDKDYYESLIESDKSRIFIVEDRKMPVIIAYTILKLIESADRPILKPRLTVYMNDFCVSDSYRGQGVGRLLFEYAVSFSRHIHADSMELSVYEFNWDARKFYEAMGMEVRSRRMEININV